MASTARRADGLEEEQAEEAVRGAPGRVELVVPLADGDGRQVLRVPLRQRTGLMMLADLAAAARDDWWTPRRPPEHDAPEPFIGFAGE